MVEDQEKKDVDDSIKFGKLLANPPPNEEVVISGMSGIFPKARNIDELKECLYNKIDLITPQNRVEFFDPELPDASATVDNDCLSVFDVGYFGKHLKDAMHTDFEQLSTLEKIVEAVMDAGLNISDLENTKTGLFIGKCPGSSDSGMFRVISLSGEGNAFGLMSSMMAAQAASVLKIQGPALLCDTACSSSLIALEHAYRAIRLGECDNAIVAGTNFCLYPGQTLDFKRLGVLSRDGHCKSFEKEGTGYVRAEATCAILLQKSKHAKRIYAQIVHTKSNSDGFKEQGITYPSGDDQFKLIKEIYEECSIPPTKLSYIEAHGTGTPVGDPEECRALENIFLPGRTTPLLVGSVKSNLGHAEPASGLCSVIKSILALESGIICPNLHFTTPRPDIPPLVNGKMKVVTELTELDQNNLIGINSFGFGGSNCHVLLKRVDNIKNNESVDNSPRLVCVSGRNKEAVECLLDDISSRELDTDYIGLLHNIFRKNTPQYVFRGFSIVSGTKEICRSIQRISNIQKKVHLIFGEIENWHQLSKGFSNVPIFNKSFQRIKSILNDKNIDLANVFNNVEQNRKSNHILGGAIVQICLADVLEELNIKTTTTIGYGYGELICAYYDKVIDLAEVLKCVCILNTKLSQNNHLVKENNSKANEMERREAVLAKAPLELRQLLKDALTDILLYPRVWKSKWIRKKNAATDYFTDASLKWINEIGVDISQFKADVLEIGFNDFVSLRELDNLEFVTFRNFVEFLEVLGKLYITGQNLLLAKLYPKINTPVKRGTPNISSKIKWMHDRQCSIIHIPTEGNKYTITVDTTIKEWQFLRGHVIDGRNLYPATGYLHLVWYKFIQIVKGEFWMTPVVLEDCRFLTAITLPKEGQVKLDITIGGTGYFEITDGSTLMVSGFIRLMKDAEFEPPTVNYHISDKNSMEQKSIYKELSLRGYFYSMEFRALEKCNLSGSRGFIRWHSNWITFIDNMLQIKILGSDTRLLYVPTHIAKITIDPHYQYKCIKRNRVDNNDAILPITYDAVTDVIRSGGVAVSHLQASSIQRKKDLNTPVLERYEFIPNNTELSMEESIRVNMQIVLENTLRTKISAVEIIDADTPTDLQVLSSLVIDVLNDQPLIQPDIKIYSNKSLEVDICVETGTLKKDDRLTVVIGSNLFERKQVFLEALEATGDGGYVISREAANIEISNVEQNDIEIITVHRLPTECIVMVCNSKTPKQSTYIKVTNLDLKWLEQVQRVMDEYDDVVLYSENEPLSGLLGFTNCLRREPGNNNARCLIVNNAKPFDPNDSFYGDQLRKNMAVNIYKNGTWGTYRHLLLDQSVAEERQHCYVSQTIRGDLSSLKWMEGPLSLEDIAPPGKQLVDIHYASLNFRDVMTASGKINADVITTNRLEQECLQGFEFSGISKSGERVMGLVSSGALASIAMADTNLLWKVPDNWSLEEAASVPVVYATVIYALRERGNLKDGESILIHSGLGGVGQAAIRYALHHRCNVFTTVGNENRKEQLKKIFPELKENHIGNSHDLSFEQMILKESNGDGVDMVLNSLSEDKLLASVRCLRKGGRFLEIGKFDVSNNKALILQLLKADCSFHGVMLDKLFDATASAKVVLKKLVLEGIANGSVKPLPRNVFKFDEIEKAFRFMAGGKHMGKVLIDLQKEEGKKFSISRFHAMPKYYCNGEQTYIIIGGLGGFGLEMVDWFIIRGARKLVLNSRNGVKNGYQRSRLRIWRKYGVVIKISTANVTKKEGCIQLIKEARSIGPVNAIFNLAAVLQDAIFQNQTEQIFQTSMSPKAYATKYLDEVSRNLCPELSQFVVFSSASCGRGNPGQTNYGMANSVMERICEERRKCGLPALAIEWGAIGEVGLVADMQENNLELEISGTVQQRVASCLKAMDVFLGQSTATIVSSMVVADKKSSLTTALTASDAVCSILGINDIKSVSPHSTLTELGMDSMTGVEIKQHLERNFDIILTAKELRSLTFARLKELQGIDNTVDDVNISNNTKTMNIFYTIKELFLSEEEFGLLESRMESNIDENETAPTVLFIPGVEGFAMSFTNLAKNLNAHAIGLNYDYENPKNTVLEDAETYLHLIAKYVKKDVPFIIVSHSYGSNLALEVVSKLESQGHQGLVISIDGAPLLIKEFMKDLKDLSVKELEITSLMQIITYEPNAIKEALYQSESMDERIDVVMNFSKSYLPSSLEWQKKIYKGILQRLETIRHYSPSYSTIKSKVILCKPKQASISNIPDDYNLSAICDQLVEVRTYHGDHISILKNEDLARYINTILETFSH